MNKEKQINDLYNFIHENTPLPQRRSRDLAIRLYDENYRKEKQGKWIDYKHKMITVAGAKIEGVIGYKCSLCGMASFSKYPYCNCGARMVGDSE